MALTALEESQLRELLVHFEGLGDVGAEASALIASLLAGDVVVTDLPAASLLAPTDAMYLAQGSTDTKITLSALSRYLSTLLTQVTINTTGGIVVLSEAQADAHFIVVTGALTSNVTLTFPAEIGKWTIFNKTTGAFSVTAIPAGGTGVPIFQGRVDTVVSDAAVMNYVTTSGITRPASDSSKALATTEFVKAAITASTVNPTQLYYIGQF